ncbi:MAG TPA: hypothetical protein PLM89_09095, partial [Anaerolineales bacterium]|nr:hypothetical protein [Anaerolineales bacterium]
TYQQPEPPPSFIEPAQPISQPVYSPSAFPASSSSSEIDWATIGLALLALATVGGLIPFWIYIYFVYNPR